MASCERESGRGQAVLAEYHANGQLDDELVLYEIDEINTVLAIENRYSEVGGIFCGIRLPTERRWE